MAKKRRHLFYLLCCYTILSISLSCHRSNNKVNETRIKKFFDNLKLKQIKFDDLFIKEKEISLETKEEFYLSARPLFKDIDNFNNFIILDNFNIRQILVFDSLGYARGKIGNEGKGPGEYLYPKDLKFKNEKYYIFDADLRRLSIFNENWQYENSFLIKVNIAKIEVLGNNKLFGFSDGYIGIPNSKNIVFEFNNKGKIINSFMEQSEYYQPNAPSEGGGIILVQDDLFSITPYEFKIHKFNQRGKLMTTTTEVPGDYVLPPQVSQPQELIRDIDKLVNYHNSWSHIIDIQAFDEAICIMYTEPRNSGHKNYLALYDLNLELLIDDIIIPTQYINILIRMNTMFLFKYKNLETNQNFDVPNPVIVEYKPVWSIDNEY